MVYLCIPVQWHLPIRLCIFDGKTRGKKPGHRNEMLSQSTEHLVFGPHHREGSTQANSRLVSMMKSPWSRNESSVGHSHFSYSSGMKTTIQQSTAEGARRWGRQHKKTTSKPEPDLDFKLAKGS